MNGSIPLGQRESQTLEFKSAALLAKGGGGGGREQVEGHASIAREVVAMLNALGGEVWVGLADEAGVAVRAEPIPAAEVEAASLRNHLIDSLEPPPVHCEVEVEVVPIFAGEKGEVLRIRVRPHEDGKPYAHLKKSRRLYVTRVGDRVVPLPREEIAAQFRRRSRAADELEEIDAVLRAEQQAFLEPGKSRFWLRLQPRSGGEIDFEKVIEREVLVDPAASGNRSAGHTFVHAYLYQVAMSNLPDRRAEPVAPRTRQIDGRTALTVSNEVFDVRLYRDGGMWFSAPIFAFQWSSPAWEKISVTVLHPEALLEYPVSVFRLASTLYEDESVWERPPGSGHVLARLAVGGLAEHALLPGSLKHWRQNAHRIARFDLDGFLLERPLVFTLREVIETPDRCGFRLVRQLYEAFGFLESDMPPEFDRASGRLVLPEFP